MVLFLVVNNYVFTTELLIVQAPALDSAKISKCRDDTFFSYIRNLVSIRKTWVDYEDVEFPSFLI